MKGGDSDDSDDDDRKRVVRSHRDKKWDQMKEGVADLSKQIKNGEWVAIQKAFDALNKLLAKSAQLVAKEGIPSFYFKALIDLEAAVSKAEEDKAAIKKMSKANAKALNSMKQNLRKTTKPHEGELAKLR